MPVSFPEVAQQAFEVCPICGGNHRLAYHRSSNGYKFPAETRNEARAMAGCVCAICGKKESNDVHHLLAIWAYKALQKNHKISDLALLDKSVLTSVYNALVVCEDCHDELHYLDELAIGQSEKEAERLKFYEWMAGVILALYHGPG